MSVEIECKACQFRLVIPGELWERRFAGRLQAIKCKKCGQRVVIDGRTATPPSDGTAEAKPPSDGTAAAAEPEGCEEHPSERPTVAPPSAARPPILSAPPPKAPLPGAPLARVAEGPVPAELPSQKILEEREKETEEKKKKKKEG